MTTSAVIVGVVGKPLGLRGEVYVRPDTDLVHEFPPGTVYHAGGRLLVVGESRLHSGRRVVRFEGVTDRAAAQALRGTVLTADRSQLARDLDEHWIADLLGAEVVDADGAPVGVLDAAADGPAHDYLVVARPDGGEVWIPAVADLVEVSEDGRIVVQAIPGLLDPG